MIKVPPDSEINDAISNFFSKYKYESFAEDSKVREMLSLDAVKNFLIMASHDYTESLKTATPYKSIKDVINGMYKDSYKERFGIEKNISGETLPEMALNYISLSFINQ
jgi:hypothetical protein